ncbi:MAG: carboxypeptidase regulatory-like domain-containing protein [Chitinophagales bacterium]|nr:carboxypeptidase regulatory-like domain-containing protein [Chitinophagaceae bacterium]MCB9063999.1 carboxypeptidase regulatory-like domain-containing protein [Chitinophagales bacterium]
MQPLSALVTVYVTNGVDTYVAIPRSDGFFMFMGLPDGNYTVTLDASLITFTDVTLNNINVTYGQTTELGTIVLTQ